MKYYAVIACFAVSTIADAAAVGSAAGGSNYAWYGADGCTTAVTGRDHTGVIGNYHNASGTIAGQLAAMYAAGQRRLRIPIPFANGASSSQNLVYDSSSCDVNGCPNGQFFTNLSSLLWEVYYTGFAEVEISFFAIGSTDPHTWTSWNAAYFNQHMGLIKKVKGIADSTSLPFKLDLLNEGMPAPSEVQLLDYTTIMWREYLLLYPLSTTVGFSIIADHPYGAGQRLSELSTVYANLPYGTTYPTTFDVHLYAWDRGTYLSSSPYDLDGDHYITEVDIFREVRNDLGTAGISSSVPWIIGETFFNDSTVANRINSTQSATSQAISYLTQWPVQITDTPSMCSTSSSVNPPVAFFNYLSDSQPVSVSPNSGSAGRQVFTVVARDSNGGASDIQYVQTLFSNSGVNALNQCYVSYDPVANVFYLLSDDATQWYGLLGGSANTIGNAQCEIHGATSYSSSSGTDLTINADVSFRSGFAGAKNIYQYTGDMAGNGSGWALMGTHTDTGDPNVVEVTSLSPLPGSGLNQTLTAVIKDGSGASTISFAQMVINTTLSGFNACFIHYDRASNVFYLLNDAGTAYSGLLAGSATQVSNSQCTLHGVGSGGSAVGTTLTVTYSLTFASGFSGVKRVNMQAVDAAGNIEAWHDFGTVTP